MVAGAAKVLETLVAVRAQHEVGFHRVAAVRALAVLHELALLQRDLQLLLVAVDLQQRRAQQAVRDDAEQRDERHDSPHVPVGTAQVRIAHHPDDGQHIQDDQQHHNHGERGLQFRSPQPVSYTHLWAARGLALVDVCGIRYVFEEGAPGEYEYRLELLEHTAGSSEGRCYLDFLRDLDIECVGTYGLSLRHIWKGPTWRLSCMRWARRGPSS